MNQRLIVVLGMHRSGTSAITRGLKALGVDLGRKLMPSSVKQNTKGFWEDQDINAFNIELLQQLTQGYHSNQPGQDWHSISLISNSQFADKKLEPFKQKAVFLLRDKLKESNIFGIKDPRICKLLPFWKDVFSHLNLNVSYIVVSRNPLSVAKSLEQRNGFKTEKCHYLWLEHMLPSMIETLGQNRIVVDYDLLMDQPESQLIRIAQKINLNMESAHQKGLEYYKNKFLDKNLRHNSFQPEDLIINSTTPKEVIEAYALFRKLAADELLENDAKVQEAFARLDNRLQAITPSLNYITHLEDQIATLNQTIGDRNDLINSIGQTIEIRDQEIESLQQMIGQRDGQIHALNLSKIEHDMIMAGRDGQIHALNLAIADHNKIVAIRETQIHKLNLAQLEGDKTIAERETQIHKLNLALIEGDKTIAERETQIHKLNLALLERDETIAERETQIHNLNLAQLELGKTIAERDKTIAERDKTIAERETQIHNLSLTLIERENESNRLNQIIAENDAHIQSLNKTINEQKKSIDEYLNSTSWRLTKPVRSVGHQYKRIKLIKKLLPRILSHGGGITQTTFKAVKVLQREGLPGVKNRLIGIQNPLLISKTNIKLDSDYAEWIRRYDTLDDTARDKIMEHIAQWPKKPKISIIVPVYDPPIKLLDEAIKSIKEQLYPEWELCIADDASKNKAVQKLLKRYAKTDKRIKVIYRKKNGHISAASNSALDLASGEYVALFDHDDLLKENALYEIAKAILEHPKAGIIYSDKDKIDLKGVRHEPYFKTDWNPELFLSHNFISHLDVYKSSLIREIGGFRIGFEGSQDYDLTLRCIEKLDPDQIIHIPKILYHWRVHPNSTAQASDAKPYALINGQKAIDEHLKRRQVLAKSELLEFNMYRVRYQLPAQKPLVSLIIPTRNGLHLIKQCIESITKKTDYPNYEIIVIDNASDDAQTLRYFKSLKSNRRIRVIQDNRPFNYSALNNAAVQAAKGELIGLINNDIEVISPDWLSEMASLALQPGVGAVGAKLWYPNDTLQHGGVILGIGGVAGHSHSLLPRGGLGYSGRAHLIQNLSAVTAACLIVLKSNFLEVGGLNETDLKIAFNDVDFCLRLREAGYRNIWTPFAELYHHESASRGLEDTPEKQARFLKETHYMIDRWKELLTNDPAYNPNLTLNDHNFSLAWPPRINQS